MTVFDPETTANMSSLNMDEYRFIYTEPDQKFPSLPNLSWRWLKRPRFQAGLVLLLFVVLATVTSFGLRVTSIYDEMIYEFIESIQDQFASAPDVFVPSELSNDEQNQLQGVADEMLLLYHTLAEMRYIDRHGIQYGPHRINVEAAIERDIDPRVIYLHQILPTIDSLKAGQLEFLFGGEFSGASFRRLDCMTLVCGDSSRSIPKCSPDVSRIVPLSVSPIGKPVMVYDTETYLLFVFDETGTLNDRTSTNSTDTLSDQGSPAIEALNAIRHMLRRLDIIPGVHGSSMNPTPDYKAVKYLYEATHWYGSFDGDSFEASLDLLYASPYDNF